MRRAQIFAVIMCGCFASAQQKLPFRMEAKIHTSGICVTRHECFKGGIYGVCNDFTWKINLTPTLINQSTGDVAVQGFEIFPDYTTSLSRKDAEQGIYDVQTNTDYFFSDDYKPPIHLEHQVPRISIPPSGRFDLPPDSAQFEIRLDFDPGEHRVSIGTYFFTFAAQVEVPGLNPAKFPVINSAPIELRIPGEAIGQRDRLLAEMQEKHLATDEELCAAPVIRQ